MVAGIRGSRLANAIIRFETCKTSIPQYLTRLVVRGLGQDWGSFMASIGPAATAGALRLDPRVTLHLSRAEATQLRRWLAAVARTLRRARRRADNTISQTA